jgi:hypothetical protein
MGLFQSISYYLRIGSNNYLRYTYHDADIKEREKKPKQKKELSRLK